MQSAKLLNNSPLVANYAHTVSLFNPNSVYAQAIRWRKPIWLPTAKSKVFRVHPRPKVPVEEAEEMKRLYNNYRTYMKSIRLYLKLQNEVNETQLDQAILDKEEEIDFENCNKINEEWNKKIAAQREIRLQEEKETRRLKTLEMMEYKKEQNKELLQKIEERVRKAKIESTTFITRENIDQAIDEALAETVNHNKAIDSDGNWYTDTTGLPPIETKSEKLQISQ